MPASDQLLAVFRSLVFWIIMIIIHWQHLIKYQVALKLTLVGIKQINNREILLVDMGPG